MNYKYTDNLQSERLVTRFATKDDIYRWIPFFEHETASRFLIPHLTKTPEEISRHMITKQLERYTEKRFGLQAILDKSSGKLLGMCGLLLQTVEEKPEIELGYHLLPQYWGNGYATEASKLFIEFAFTNKLTNSLISVIDIENYPSQAVAERNGFKREKQIKYLDDEDVFIYRISRE